MYVFPEKNEGIAKNVYERELFANANRAGAFYRVVYRDRLLKRKDHITNSLNQPVKRIGSRKRAYVRFYSDYNSRFPTSAYWF